MNRYPTWKYALLVIALLVGLVYAWKKGVLEWV